MNIFESKKINKGFTLIEVMVSTSIFISVMMVAMGSLIVVNNTAKRSQQLRLAMDNVNFAMESMTRSLRMGTNYICKTGSDNILLGDANQTATDCPITGEAGYLVAFKPSITMTNGSAFFAFKLNKDLTTGNNSLQRCDQYTGCVDVTSPDVNIDTLKFWVRGSSSSDNIQPSIYIVMKGTVTIKGESSSFALQTLVTQRSYVE